MRKMTNPGDAGVAGRDGSGFYLPVCAIRGKQHEAFLSREVCGDD